MVAMLLPLLLCAQGSRLSALLKKYPLKEMSKQSFAKAELSASDCRALTPLLIEIWKEEVYQRLSKDAEQQFISYGDLKMEFAGEEFGEMPENGYSLYISMHGGGNTAHEVNDQQWKNQISLYTPEEGIYIAPRAPWDDWNMWFKPGMDELLENLIQWMVAEYDVNPNKVYLMGYSAGGDGVWRMAPRMADRWAAASMMAGHPGEAQQVNLMNVPFMIWMGEKDNAYDRNRQAIKKGAVMDSLEAANPLSYIHETHIVPGKGHWMDRADTLAVSWMANFEREPLPAHVVWRQEDVVRPSLYWLEVNPQLAKPGMRVEAVVDGNEVKILHCDYKQLCIRLNDEMLDLNQPVKVTFKGKVLFEGKLKRTLANMAQTLADRGDVHWMFSTYIDITL